MSSELINPDGLYSIRQTAKLEDICVATTYVRMANGEYEAFKDGRKTKIPGWSILGRRSKHLKPAKFKAQPSPNRLHTIRRTADASTA
jgi:hypothetical protein